MSFNIITSSLHYVALVNVLITPGKLIPSGQVYPFLARLIPSGQTRPLRPGNRKLTRCIPAGFRLATMV